MSNIKNLCSHVSVEYAKDDHGALISPIVIAVKKLAPSDRWHVARCEEAGISLRTAMCSLLAEEQIEKRRKHGRKGRRRKVLEQRLRGEPVSVENPLAVFHTILHKTLVECGLETWAAEHGV